jgi:GNAT superfamily N-acetyltransferase
MITIYPTVTAALLARFVLESELEYPCSDEEDGRLACWQGGEGLWAVAAVNNQVAGIACVVRLEDEPYAGYRCLYWIEVLRPFRRQGVGAALLRWAEAQADNCPLLIRSVPAAAPFYRRHLAAPASEIAPNTFVVRARAGAGPKGGVRQRAMRRVTRGAHSREDRASRPRAAGQARKDVRWQKDSTKCN